MTAISVALFTVFVVTLVVAEHRRPLRRRVETQLPRTGRNVTVAGLAGVASAVTELPVAPRVARWAARRRVGLLRWLPLPTWMHMVAGVLLLDYTLWIWHWLNHRVPVLWRFHVVHHVDRDLDASTGVRFHFGEMALSTGLRAAQVLLLGVEQGTVTLFQAVLFASVLFHHSNLRLPSGLERVLCRMIVTPRMHGIHHSMVERETNSNFSSVLAWWDRLHRTLRLNVPQPDITIGVPAYSRPAEVTLRASLTLPFGRQRPSWVFPDGRRPDRPASPHHRTRLLP